MVMATIPINSQMNTSTDEENRTDSDTDLSAENTEDELHANISTWSPADKKKLQYMTGFHQEYQHVFREGASIWMIMKRRISHMNPTIDSYSESISSNEEESSDDRTVTLGSNSSAAPAFQEVPCKWEADSKGIEATLHQITAGLQSAAEGYLALASHMSKVAPYELPQVVAQIPPPPMDVSMPIQKTLLVDGESKVVNHLIHGEYELNNTSWSKLQKKYNVSRNKIYTAIK